MNKLFHWLWLVFGVLLTVCGALAILSPDATLLSMAWLIGAILLASGVCDIVSYSYLGWMAGSGWILCDGIAAVIVAVFLLGNGVFTAAALPYAFGMWVTVSGIQKAIFAFDLNKLGVRGWGWMLALGVALAGLGVLSFADPVFGGVAISVLVGMLLISYGVSAIAVWFFVQRARRLAKESAII